MGTQSESVLHTQQYQRSFRSRVAAISGTGQPQSGSDLMTGIMDDKLLTITHQRQMYDNTFYDFYKDGHWKNAIIATNK